MRKWLILVSYSAASFINGSVWASLISIPDKARSYYGINDAEITLYSYIYFISSILLGINSAQLLSKSFFVSLHLTWAVTLIGCWIRFLASTNFWISFLGQFFVSSSNMLVLSSITVVAVLWFEESEMTLAMSIATSSNFIGIGFSLLFTAYNPDIYSLVLTQVILASIFFPFNLLVLRKERKEIKELSFKESYIRAVKDKIHLGMTVCCGSIIAVNYSILSVLGLLLEEFGYAIEYVGLSGFFFTFFSLIGGFFASYISEKKKNTIEPLKIYIILTIISGIVISIAIEYVYLFLVASVILGFFINGVTPLSLRMCILYLPDVEESVPNNITYLLAQIFSSIYVYPIQYSKELTTISGLWIGSILLLITSVIFLIILRKVNKKVAIDLVNLVEKSKSPLNIDSDEDKKS